MVIYSKLNELEAVSTAHLLGTKKVLSKGRNDLTRVTQIAFGNLLPSEEIPVHKHTDMDECFFFTRGLGSMKVNNQEFELSEGVFLTVPATAEHSIKCTDDSLEFFYFGLQVFDNV